MRKNYYLLALSLFLSPYLQVQAQTPTFAEDIAPIIWENCSKCHNPTNGIGNANLITYQDVFSWAGSIKQRINSTDVFQQMPPWPPNSDYQNYAHERVLLQTEIDDITSWVDNGTPTGDTANMAAPPTFSNGSFLGTPDLQLTAPNYTSKATFGNDDYVCFVVPTGLATTKYVKAIEVVPGNREIVHHVVVYKDNSGFQTDTIGGDCGGPENATLLTGFTPGESPTIYPNTSNTKMGVRLDPGDNIVLNLHYPEGSGGQTDQTSIHLFFYDDTVATVREVTATPALSNSTFCINPNEIDSVEETFTVPVDVSVLSVMPHAHLLGKSFLVYATTPTNDTIQLIDIPQWNFEWQGFYYFKNIIKIPQGSVVYGKALYDNTTNNVYNPNNPPQTVCEGENTSDEMFKVYFHYTPYQTGDENINLETGTKRIANQASELSFAAYPNPFRHSINLQYQLKQDAEVSLQIYNLQGQLLSNLVQEWQPAGQQTLSWNGEAMNGQQAASGLYLAYLRVGDQLVTKKIMLHR